MKLSILKRSKLLFLTSCIALFPTNLFAQDILDYECIFFKSTNLIFNGPARVEALASVSGAKNLKEYNMPFQGRRFNGKAYTRDPIEGPVVDLEFNLEGRKHNIEYSISPLVIKPKSQNDERGWGVCQLYPSISVKWKADNDTSSISLGLYQSNFGSQKTVNSVIDCSAVSVKNNEWINISGNLGTLPFGDSNIGFACSYRLRGDFSTVREVKRIK